MKPGGQTRSARIVALLLFALSWLLTGCEGAPGKPSPAAVPNPSPVTPTPTASRAARPPTATPAPVAADTPTHTHTGAPTPAATHSGQIDLAAWEVECVQLTNRLRAEHGLPPLKGEPILAGTARSHARDMAARGYLDHITPDGVTFLDRLRAAGYSPTGYRGENILVGWLATPQIALEWWFDEEPPDDWHRRNLLSANFRELGCGIALDPEAVQKRYFAQDFGQRAGVFPLIIAGEASSTAQRSVSLYLYGQSWGASEMILSENPDFEGATWQAFAPTSTWTLSPGSGLKTVYATIRNVTGEVRGPVCDTIQLLASETPSPPP